MLPPRTMQWPDGRSQEGCQILAGGRAPAIPGQAIQNEPHPGGGARTLPRAHCAANCSNLWHPSRVHPHCVREPGVSPNSVRLNPRLMSANPSGSLRHAHPNPQLYNGPGRPRSTNQIRVSHGFQRLSRMRSAEGAKGPAPSKFPCHSTCDFLARIVLDRTFICVSNQDRPALIHSVVRTT